VNDTAYDGVFIIRPTVAPARLLPDLHLDGAFIQTNRLMETNLPGTFAAGDCTGTPLQIAKAAGEGNIAALTACTYLEPKRREAKDAKSSQQGA
jgi:thioredoxin reductase (NADPH)